MKVGIKYLPYRTVDTVELARILFPTQKSYRLVDLSNSLNFFIASIKSEPKPALSASITNLTKRFLKY